MIVSDIGENHAVSVVYINKIIIQQHITPNDNLTYQVNESENNAFIH